jgi:hypothetical protein
LASKDGGENMKNIKRNLLNGFLLILLMLGMTCTVCALDNSTFGPETTNGEPLWKLLSASDAVTTNLSRIEMALVNASLELSETGIDGPEARAILLNITKVDPSIIDCITIDVNGTVREVEPESFANIKGENLKWQQHVNDTLNTKLYSGFYFINTVEGLYATDSEMPVFDKNGTFIGTVSILFNQSQFFTRILDPLLVDGKYKMWVGKADDATILYETDSSQILLNRSSPLYQDYPTLLELFDRMSYERTGYGTYEFLDQSRENILSKGCYWTTIPNKGTEMRLVIRLDLNQTSVVD